MTAYASLSFNSGNNTGWSFQTTGAYSALSSVDSGNNTGWTFDTSAGFYFAYNSIDSGNNNGWNFFSFTPTVVNQNAKRDENNVTTLLATSNDSNVTGTIRLKADPTTHGIYLSDDTTGINYGYENAGRDSNYVTVIMGVSSADGTTPVPIYADSSTGYLLVDSN